MSPVETALPLPRIELEEALAERLDLVPLAMQAVAPNRISSLTLAVTGVGVLALGLSMLATGNFVAAQFARSTTLGWLTLGVAVAGFGLIGTGIWRELRGLFALRTVDRLRAELASGDIIRMRKAARHWIAELPDGADLLPALEVADQPATVTALLKAGPANNLRGRADLLGRNAAMQMVAGMAVAPSPALVMLMISWRGVRLIRQVAELHGMRPGLLGTLGLLRRTTLAATSAAATELAVNSVTHALLSNPHLQHVLGEMAGAAVAARRMIMLARAASLACSPIGE